MILYIYCKILVVLIGKIFFELTNPKQTRLILKRFKTLSQQTMNNLSDLI